MHRIDAELTAGLPVSPLADGVAAGAVDHAVDVMWGWMPATADYRVETVVEFVASDTAQRWLVEVGTWSQPATDTGSVESGPRAQRAIPGRAAATVTATVEDLALWTWTRGGEVSTSGDTVSLAALRAVVAEGIQ